MSKTKEVAAYSAEVPEFLKDQTSHLGSEDVGMEDLTLPRLSLIQDLSPQHKKTKDEYIEGAEAGMVFNTVSQELLGTALNVVPVYYAKEWIIWKDQAKGGGFRGAFKTEAEAKAAMLELEDAADCEVVDTAQNYVLLVSDDGSFQEAVISMSKSQMKVSRKWNSQIRMAGGDRFTRVYQLSVITDQNGAGQEYYNWSVKPLGFVNKELYDSAKQSYMSIKAGDKTINRSDDSSDDKQSAPSEIDEQDELNM